MLKWPNLGIQPNLNGGIDTVQGGRPPHASPILYPMAHFSQFGAHPSLCLIKLKDPLSLSIIMTTVCHLIWDWNLNHFIWTYFHESKEHKIPWQFKTLPFLRMDRIKLCQINKIKAFENLQSSWTYRESELLKVGRCSQMQFHLFKIIHLTIYQAVHLINIHKWNENYLVVFHTINNLFHYVDLKSHSYPIQLEIWKWALNQKQ